MRFDKENDCYVLKNGKKLYANGGLLSLRRGEAGWEIREGYDGPAISQSEIEPLPAWQTCEPWTRDEMQEIAQHMIELWQAFAADMAKR